MPMSLIILWAIMLGLPLLVLIIDACSMIKYKRNGPIRFMRIGRHCFTWCKASKLVMLIALCTLASNVALADKPSYVRIDCPTFKGSIRGNDTSEAKQTTMSARAFMWSSANPAVMLATDGEGVEEMLLINSGVGVIQFIAKPSKAIGVYVYTLSDNVMAIISIVPRQASTQGWTSHHVATCNVQAATQ
jgi:hypothetical protein